MTWGQFDEGENKAVPEGREVNPAYEIQAGDILVSRANTRSYVGAPVLVGNTRPRLLLSDKSLRLVPGESINKRWLVHFLSSPAARDFVSETATGTKDSMRNISQQALLKMPMAVPPLAEQLRIADVLEDYLSRLDVAEASIRRSVRRSDHAWASVLNSVARGDLNGRTVHAGLRLVSEVAVVGGGIQKQQKRRPVRNTFPFLRVANVARGKLDLDEIHQIELFDGELERYQLERGDLLVVEGNGSPDQIGRAATWRGEISHAVHQNHLIRVRPSEELLPRYLELIWNSPLVIDQLREVSRSTSGLYTLSTAKVKSVKIPVPSLADQESLVDDADIWETRINAARVVLQSAAARSRHLRNSVLNKALAGALIPQDPQDEPASTLLERIEIERAKGVKRRSNRTPRPRRAAAAVAAEPYLTPSVITPIPSDAIQQEFEL